MAISQEEFNKLRKFAGSGLESLAKELDSLKLGDAAEEIRELAQRMAEGTFKIIVTGVFNAGKSTLLNAMMGRRILPEHMTPTTAIITRIKYGSTPQAIIKYKDTRVPDRIMSLDDFFRIKLSNEDMQNNNSDNFDKIKEAIVHYPLEILRHNVEIIDSPGLDDNPVRTQRTLEMLDKMDAVLLLLPANAFFTGNNKEYIEETLFPKGLKNIFFGINCWDMVDHYCNNPEQERELIRNRAKEVLTPYCQVDGSNLFSNRTFYISAKQAVDGRERNDIELVDKSNIPQLERELDRFLIEDRGRVEFQRIIERVRILQQDRVQKTIDTISATLGTSVEVLEQRLAEVAPKLDNLNNIKQKILGRVATKEKQTQEYCYNSYLQKMRYIQDELLPSEVNTFDFSEVGRVKAMFSDGKAQVQRIFEREAGKVVQSEMGQWSEDIKDYFGEIFTELLSDIEEYSLDYQREADGILRHFSGETDVIPMQTVKPNWVATFVGILLQDPATAVGGHTEGWSGIMKNFGISFGVAFVSSLVLGPVGIIPWLAVQGWQILKAANPSNLARKLAENIKQDRLLEKAAKENESKVKASVSESFAEVIEGLSVSMDRDIKELEGTLREVIDSKRSQERSASEEKARLEGIKERFESTISDMERRLLSVDSGVA